MVLIVLTESKLWALNSLNSYKVREIFNGIRELWLLHMSIMHLPLILC